MSILNPKSKGYRNLDTIVLTDDDRRKFQEKIDKGHFGIDPNGTTWMRIRTDQKIREVVDLNTGHIINQFEPSEMLSDKALALFREKVTLSYGLERTRARAEGE